MSDKNELNYEFIGNFNPEGREDVEHIKGLAKDLAEAIVLLCPAGRRKSLALTNLETSAMYAVKSLFEG